MAAMCNEFKVKKATAAAVRNMVKGGFFSKSNHAKIDELSALASKLAAIYNIACPSVKQWPCGAAYGFYTYQTMCITMTKPSIVTFLHEFRHHMQYNKPGIRIRTSEAYDAQAWAVSTYKAACPKLFLKAARAGKIKGVWEAI